MIDSESKEITIMGFGGSASGGGSCMSGEMFLVDDPSKVVIYLRGFRYVLFLIQHVSPYFTVTAIANNQ